MTDEAEALRSWTPTHRHYKGSLYRTICTPNREGDLESMVVYDDERGHMFVRPMAEFNAKFTRLHEDFDNYLDQLEAALLRKKAREDGE